MSALTFAAQKTDTLFILQDAGETQALLPVIELYEKYHEDYRILAAGVAAEQLSHSLSYASLGVTENITEDLQKRSASKDFFKEMNMPKSSAQMIYNLISSPASDLQ